MSNETDLKAVADRVQAARPRDDYQHQIEEDVLDEEVLQAADPSAEADAVDRLRQQLIGKIFKPRFSEASWTTLPANN